MPKRSTAASAAQVLAALPAGTEVWLGGRGVSAAALMTQGGSERMQVFSQLDEIAAAAADWRTRHLV
jgi:hypothetical protein